MDDPAVKSPSLLISEGRHLYIAVDYRCGPPYTVVLDEDYKTLCPWAQTHNSENVWSEDMTDAAVEVLDSEADNREQRRAKRKSREKSRRRTNDTAK